MTLLTDNFRGHYHPQTKLRDGKVFTRVCPSTYAPQDHTPLRPYLPLQTIPPPGTTPSLTHESHCGLQKLNFLHFCGIFEWSKAGPAHPTGIHSCC